MKFIKKIILIWILFSTLVLASKIDLSEEKTVLVLHTLKSKQPWILLFNKYLQESIIGQVSIPCEIEFENLDLIEFSNEEYKVNLKELLTRKYTDQVPDVIIVTFPSAIDFIDKYHLFPDIPKIFIMPSELGIDHLSNTRCLPFAYDFSGNIEHCLELLPKTKNIYVVSGNAVVDKRTVEMFREDTKELSDKVAFHYLTEMSINDLLGSIHDLPRNSIIYYLSYSLDSNHNNVIAVDFSAFLGENSNCPVFTYLDLFALGTGIVGGRVTTTRNSVNQAASIIEKLFHGEAIDTIQTKEPFFEYIYDWKQLKKYNIDIKKLPKGSLIQNRQFTFYELYKFRIYFVIFIIIIQSITLIFLLINIKKRKTTQIELEHRSKIISQVHDSILIIDLHDKIIDINYGAEILFGYMKEEIVGKPVSFLMTDKYKDKFVNIVANYLNDRDEYNLEISIKRKTGEIAFAHLSVSLIRNADGKPDSAIIYALNTTDRKIAEDALRNATQLLDNAFVQAPIGMLLVKPNGNFHQVNEAFCNMVGYLDYELLKLNYQDITFPEDSNISSNIVKELISGKIEKASFEKRYKHKNGNIVYTQVSTVLLRDENDEPLYFFTQVLDLTERKKDEQEKAKMQVKLQQTQKIEAIGTLAGGIAHDFNNILTIILGNTELVLYHLDPGNENYQLLKDVKRASNRAKLLTQQLLTFSKGGDPIKEVLQLNQVIINSANSILKNCNVSSEYEIPDDLWQVEADQGQITQVIRNIVMNAEQAVTENGQIKISCKNISGKPEGLPTLVNGEYIQITISDNGIGISDDNKNKIFDPFFSTKNEGNGLGLSICHSVIRKHNGAISVDSEYNVGTTVTIYLPAFRKQNEDYASFEMKSTQTGDRATILIMDDEPMLRKMMSTMITTAGYDVLQADKGQDAIKIYQEYYANNRKIDIVILDLTVPGGLGGKDTARELLKINPNAKLVVASGYSNDPVMANHEDYGFYAKIAKPFQFADLNNIINQILRINN